ncbi:helix-turn-helix transcriptional regulator [Spirochaeta lutea]|uniref:hypothetical protein n=1 Tax=Spirochaeta lutea TaxID=1480694 RepID=UPI000B29FA48|nr:hypothetical protein [Spirochaeta lutea]
MDRCLQARYGVTDELLSSHPAGHSLYKYVQTRRLAEAGAELLLGRGKVIDLALKYQYGSPEAFTRAFDKEYAEPNT